jgi:hypothetical protein
VTRYHLTLPDSDSPLGRWVMDLADALGTGYTPDAIAAAVSVLAHRAAGRICPDCGHPPVEHDDRVAVASGATPTGCKWWGKSGAVCGCTRRFPAEPARGHVAPTDLRDADNRDAAAGLRMKLGTAREVGHAIKRGMPYGEVPMRRALLALLAEVDAAETRRRVDEDSVIATQENPTAVVGDWDDLASNPDAPVTVYVATSLDPVASDTHGAATTRDGALALLGAAWLRQTANGDPTESVPAVRPFVVDDPADRQAP